MTGANEACCTNSTSAVSGLGYAVGISITG